MNLHFAALLILSVTVSTEGCCTPEKWEGRIGEMGGVVKGGRPHVEDRRHHPHPPPPQHPEVFGMEIAMAYNAESEEIAMITPSREGRMKHISNFKKERAFIVLNTTCKYFNMTKKFQQFCTDKGTKTGSALLGGSLLVDMYKFKMQGIEGHASFTEDCIPVSEMWYGKMRRDYFMMNVGFFNVTEGIKDPDMFKHPEGCEPARGDMDSYLESLGVSSIARYLAVNKFTGEPLKTSGKYFPSRNDIF